MIRMTKQTDYGFVLLSHLAKAPERVVNAPDLAAETRLPVPMVSKILKLLARHALLRSHRGVKGGYSLARPAAEITAAQIVLHMAEVELYWVHHVVDGEPYEDYVAFPPEGQVGWVTAYDAPDHNALLFTLEEAHRHTQRWFGLPASELAKTYSRKRRDGTTQRPVAHTMIAIPVVATPSRARPMVHGLASMERMMMGTAPIMRIVIAASPSVSTGR